MKFIILIIGLVFSSTSLAFEHYGEFEIKQILGFSGERPNQPNSTNLTRVYFKNNTGWDSNKCRNSAADLSKDDEHLMSILLFAWAAKKTLVVGVDDRLKPYDDACQIVWLRAID